MVKARNMRTFALAVAKALAKITSCLVGLSHWFDDKPELHCSCASKCCTYEERTLRYMKTNRDLTEVLLRMTKTLEDKRGPVKRDSHPEQGQPPSPSRCGDTTPQE